MAQTRLDIYPEVIHRVGLPEDDRKVTTEKVYRDINAALRKIAIDFDWPWLYTETNLSLTNGATFTNLPADCVKLVWAAIDENPLENIQRRKLQMFSQLTGFPRVYSAYSGRLTLHPTANDDFTVTIGYIQSENTLLDDNDEVLCPDHLIDIVYLYAASQTAMRLKDAVLRETLEDEIKEWKKRAADSVKPAKGTYRPQIGRVW